MLDPKLVPTELVRAEERTWISIVATTPPSDHWVIHFLRIVLRFGMRVLGAFLTRRLNREEHARLFRMLLEDLGGLWIKAGQLLSLRVDLFSQEFCRELTKLQYRAEGFPTRIARKIIEEDLGASIESIFDEFGEEPFATASIGQIYRAHLRNEDVWVAVKVQRPYIAMQFDRDLSLIAAIVKFFRRFPRWEFWRWDEALWELNNLMHEELDYRYEASAIRRMRKTLKRHDIYVPEVFSRYLSKRVLVTEFIHAALMSDFISLYRADPARLSNWLQENNIDPRLVARRLILSVFRQLYEDNLFHGDLHPGNILLLRDSRVAFIDLGSIGFSETEFLTRFKFLVNALALRDFDKAADMAFLLIDRIPSIDLEVIKAKLIRMLRGWAARSFVRELPYHEKSMDGALVEMTKIMLEDKVTIEWAFLRIRRVLTTLDSALVHLYPDVNYIRLMEDYFAAAEKRSLAKAARELPARTVKGVRDLFELQERGNEYLFLQRAIIRRQAQVFEGTTSKFAYLFQIVFGQLASVELAAGIVFLVGFLHQHHHDLVQPWMGPQIERLAAMFPPLDYQLWLIVLLVDVYLYVTAFRLKSKFAERETRSSDRNGGF